MFCSQLTTEVAFTNLDLPTPDPLERLIAAELWRWAFLAEEARHELFLPQGQLAVSLEFYLCGLFPLAPVAQSLGWWSDGVLELSICRIHRTAFRIVGVTYLGPSHMAPFELEFHFARRCDLAPARVILRCGELDHTGSLRLFTREKHANLIMQNRPTQNRDWVIAVEITPDVR